MLPASVERGRVDPLLKLWRDRGEDGGAGREDGGGRGGRGRRGKGRCSEEHGEGNVTRDSSLAVKGGLSLEVVKRCEGEWGVMRRAG